MHWSLEECQTYGLGYRTIHENINSVLLAGTVTFQLWFRAVVLRVFPIPGASALPGNLLKMEISMSYIESKHWSRSINLKF